MPLFQTIMAAFRKTEPRSDADPAHPGQQEAGLVAVPAPRPCPATGASGSRLKVIGEVPVTHGNPISRSHFRLIYSESADLIYLDPLPSEQDLSSMYENAVQFAGDVYTEPERVTAMLDYYGHWARHHFPATETHWRVLEVGAGLAWVSRAVKSVDPEAVTVAQDVSGEVASQCPWVDEYCVDSIEQVIDRHAEPFDVISLTHVIEHLPDPFASIEVLSRKLAPGGKFFITAPYRPPEWQPQDSVQQWLDYAYLHVPAHITYLSERSMQILADRLGMTVDYWNHTADEGQAFEALLAWK